MILRPQTKLLLFVGYTIFTLLALLERAFKKIFENECTLYLPCKDKKTFFTSKDHRGHKLVRMYEAHYHIFWIIFKSDLVISYTDKLLVFRWVQIVLRFHDFSFRWYTI